MSQASRTIRRPRRRRVLRQWLRSLGRLPLWTAVGLSRWLERGFWLEREARRSVRGWMSRERCRQLERTIGKLPSRYGMVLAYLAAKAPTRGDVVQIGSWASQATAWLTEGVRQRSDRPQIISIEAQEPDDWQPAPDHVQRIDSQAHRMTIQRTRLQNIGASYGRPVSLIWMDQCASALESCRMLERFLPNVTRGGWIVCDVPPTPTAVRTRAAIGRRLARGAQFRRIATIGQIEIFRRDE